MRYPGVIIMLLFVAFLHNSASGQYRAKYRVVIKTAANKRYAGSFISINDSLLMMVGPGKIDSSKKITTYKNGYITLKPEEVRSIRIARKSGAAIGAAIGLAGGVALGLLIVNSSEVNSGDGPASDIVVDIASVIADVFIGSRLGVLGTLAGAKTGQLLSIKLNLKDLDLKGFSSVKDQLEPYHAKLNKEGCLASRLI